MREPLACAGSAKSFWSSESFWLSSSGCRGTKGTKPEALDAAPLRPRARSRRIVASRPTGQLSAESRAGVDVLAAGATGAAGGGGSGGGAAGGAAGPAE